MSEPSGSVAGKVILVTGAGQGIGREIALLAAREGAKVVVNDLGGSADGEGADAGFARQVVSEIEAAGGEGIANAASVSDPAGAQSMIDDAIRAFGRIDAVINNAGILRDRIFHRMSLVDWQQVIDVHLNGCFNTSKAAAPYFKEQGSGAFVHFTSTSGLIGAFGQANYAAAKMGIVGLSTSLALDMQRFGVRSNCIAPFAWSRLAATIPTDTEDAKLRVARAQTMTPAKIAPLSVALCSDRAMEVTSQIFCVRKNEIFLFSQPRPIRSMQRENGWTPDSICSDLIPAFRASFQPMQRSVDVFGWDPV